MENDLFLNEAMGVPSAINPWIDIFTKIILEDIKQEIRGGWSEVGTYNVGGESGEVEIYGSRQVVVKGDDVMSLATKQNNFSEIKDFVESETFQNLPLWKPTLVFRSQTLPDEVYDQYRGKSLIEARIETISNQKLVNIGKHEVFPNVKFVFNPILPNSGINRYFLGDLRSTIAHELLHAYQKYQQLKKGKPSHFGQETLLNALANIPELKEPDYDDWSKFLRLVYLHLSFEINARIPQLYEMFKEMGVNTKEKFLKELPKTDIWMDMKELESFDAKKFVTEFTVTSDLDGKVQPLKYLSLLMRDHSLEIRGVDPNNREDVLKHLMELWDSMLGYGSKEMERRMGISFKNLKLPQHIMENPYLFFKFFEKRFHKRAEKWKRKIYRIGSLLLQDNK